MPKVLLRSLNVRRIPSWFDLSRPKALSTGLLSHSLAGLSMKMRLDPREGFEGVSPEIRLLFVHAAKRGYFIHAGDPIGYRTYLIHVFPSESLANFSNLDQQIG